MGLNFPNAPTLNQLHPDPAQAGIPQYKWDGTAWVVASTGGGGGGSTAGDIAFTPITGIDADDVQGAIAELQDEKVAKAGDYMSGDLVITKTSPAFKLNAGGGGLANVHGQRGNQDRWTINMCAGVDTGSNGGSDFILQNYDDSGNLLGTAMAFLRATGLGMVKGDPTAALGIATKQYVDDKVSSIPISIPIVGVPAANAVINVPCCIALTIPAALAGTKIYQGVQTTANSVFTVNKISGGTTTALGTITFTTTDKYAATLAGAGGSLAVGDVIQLVGPATPDTTLADIGLTLSATRA